MNLKEKYIKKYLRFFKENNYYDKQFFNNEIKEIKNCHFLPHIYVVPSELRKKYISFIEEDLCNDIIDIIKDRLDYIDFKSFEFDKNKFKNKKDFINYLIEHYNIKLGLRVIDKENKKSIYNVIINPSSISLIEKAFFE